MKKMLVLLLTLTLCFSCAPVLAEEAERETFKSGGFTYALLEDGTAEITRYKGDTGELAIPDDLDGHSVTAVGDRAFEGCSGLTSVTIPDSVTSIGDGAFRRSGLTSVTIPDSVTDLGVNPFARCDSLAKIIVSQDHPSLATIDGVLFSKPDKRLVTWPCAFTRSDYTIPQGIKIIGDSAFESCSGLTSITIPDSVTSIDDDAFWGCSGLTSVAIPDSVTDLGGNPFAGCDNLAKIIVSQDHPSLATIDGVLFSKPDKRLVTWPCAFTRSDYTIPQGIKIIGDGAFGLCSSLTAVAIPDSVTSIGDWAFDGCSGLTAVTIPDNVTSIGDEAFVGCNSLTSVIVGRDSYAKQYCIDHDLPYVYADANDWLNE